MSFSLDGPTITKCFDVVSRCGKEINALSEVLNGMLRQELSNKDNTLPCVLTKDGKPIYEARIDDTNWAYTDISYSFPLKTKGKNRKAEMYLSYQVSLAGDGVLQNSIFSGPLLHVCLWDSAINFEDSYMGFPIDPDYKHEVIADRLIVWSSGQPESWKERSWTFSVGLVSLTSKDDLKKSIVQPALDLLKMVSVKEALPDDLPGLVLYPETSLNEPFSQTL